MRTIDQMVQQEVMCCMSHLVATLAYGCGSGGATKGDLADLCEQAHELSYPVPDYEEAATQAGWEPYTDKFGVACWSAKSDDSDTPFTFAGTAEQLCIEHELEPYDREVFEHWAVTQWLADKLVEAGEKVDTDFGGLNVWARTCSGQGIASDGVIERIYAGMMK